MYTFVEVANYLLDTYSTHYVIAIGASEIVTFKMISSQKADRFSEALKDKTLSWENEFSELRTKGIFLKEQTVNARDNIQMYLAANPTIH